MSSTSGPVKEAKKTVTMQPSQPMLQILTLPSTSKGLSKEETSLTTEPAKKISHSIPVPMTAADGTVKYVHIAPLDSLPKHSLASAKKLPPGSKPELSMLPKLEIPKQVLVATNVRPIKLATSMHVGPIKSLGTVLEAQPISEMQPTPGDKEDNKGQSSNLPIITNCISIANREDWQHFMAEFRKVRQINSNPVKQIKNTSTQIKNTSKQISNTSKQITNTSKQINSTSKQINNTSKEMKNTSKQIKNTSKSTVNEKTASKTITETVPKGSKDNPSPERQAKPLSKKTLSKKPKNKDKSPPGSPQTNNSPRKKVPKERAEVNMYVADGFREDVEDLLEKCLEVSKLNFDKFGNIWREMDFSCIFHGRQSSAELAELSEEFIHIAKYHMLARNVSFEENVAGLFLVYALLNLQPYERFAALRLVPDDVPAVLRLEAEARRQKRHDVLYILGHVLIKGPCQFHVLVREVAIEPAIRKYYDGTVQLTNASDTVLTRNAECVPILKELSSLEQRARQMREKLRERHAGRDNVSKLCKRPATQLLELFKEHTVHGQQVIQLKNKNIDKVSKSEEDRAQLLRAIKNRAVSNVVDPMKHLTSVEERQLTDDSTTDESEIIPVKRTKLKRRAKGRGRSLATNLRDLFSCDETADEECVPEHSRKEMPILDTTDRDSDYSEDEQKPKIKINQHKTKSKNTDDKQKGKKNSPVAKKKTGKKNVVDFSDPYLDLINVEDLVPPEDTTEVNLNISMDPIIEDEEVTNKTIKGNDIETLLNSPNANKITSTKIEIEVIDNEVQTKAETGNIQEDKKVSRVPNNQKAMTSKNTTNSNTISPKCVRRKTNPKLVPRTKKADINKKGKDDTPNSSLDERSGSTKTLKSPTTRKTYPGKQSSNKSSLESSKSRTSPRKKEVLSVNKEQEDQMTPKIKKESPKEKDVDSPGKPKTKKQSPRKTDVQSPGTPRTKKESPRKTHVGSPGTPSKKKESPKKTDVGSPGTPSKKKESPRKTHVGSPGTPRKKKHLSKNEEEKFKTKSSPRKRSKTCVDKADAKKCKMDPDLILNTK